MLEFILSLVETHEQAKIHRQQVQLEREIKDLEAQIARLERLERQEKGKRSGQRVNAGRDSNSKPGSTQFSK